MFKKNSDLCVGAQMEDSIASVVAQMEDSITRELLGKVTSRRLFSNACNHVGSWKVLKRNVHGGSGEILCYVTAAVANMYYSIVMNTRNCSVKLGPLDSDDGRTGFKINFMVFTFPLGRVRIEVIEEPDAIDISIQTGRDEAYEQGIYAGDVTDVTVQILSLSGCRWDASFDDIQKLKPWGQVIHKGFADPNPVTCGRILRLACEKARSRGEAAAAAATSSAPAELCERPRESKVERPAGAPRTSRPPKRKRELDPAQSQGGDVDRRMDRLEEGIAEADEGVQALQAQLAQSQADLEELQAQRADFERSLKRLRQSLMDSGHLARE